MDPWDLFTWVSAAALGISAMLIFVLFLRDAGAILKQERRDQEED